MEFMSFIDELKRRKVFRVAASYAAVAFIIMQLVEIVFPIFDFPQWTSQFVIIVVLLGFPIAIILIVFSPDIRLMCFLGTQGH